MMILLDVEFVVLDLQKKENQKKKKKTDFVHIFMGVSVSQTSILYVDLQNP